MEIVEKLQLKKHVLTGAACMIPVVVADGICLGTSRIFGGVDIQEGMITAVLEQIGSAAIGFTIPVIAVGIVYSIANRPGIAPGLAAGTLANVVGAGFPGGLAGGFIAGYLAWLAKTYIKPPKLIEGLMPVPVIPVLSTLAVGLVLMYLIGTPLAMIQQGVTDWLLSLQGESGFLIGTIVDGMRFDMGGPFAQVTGVFYDAMFTWGVYAPKAASMISGMTPPVGVVIAVFLVRKRSTEAEHEVARTAFPLGLCFIIEGVSPFPASDPLRIVAACTAGSAISGGLAVIFGCLCPIPADGVFAIPFITESLLFVVVFLAGVAVTTGVLPLLKPNRSAVAEDTEEDYGFTIEFNTK